MTKIIVSTEENLRNTLYEVLDEFDKVKSKNRSPRLYSINQIAIKLHLAHSTVSKLTKKGLIKTTLDGKITEDAINEYLQLK